MNRNLKLNNSGRYSRMAFRGALGVLGVLLAAATGSGQSAEDLRLTVGKSVVIDYPSDIRQISTSSPDIVDAAPVTTREILLHGKGLGNATLVVWSKSLICVQNNSVTFVYRALQEKPRDGSGQVSRLRGSLHFR